MEIPSTLRGIIPDTLFDMLWSLGVVAASPYGGVEGSPSILFGGILERVALRIFGNGGKGGEWVVVVAAPP